MAAEAAKEHSDWLDDFPEDYPPRIRELILEGRSSMGPEYFSSKDRLHLMLQGRSLMAQEYFGAERRMSKTRSALVSAFRSAKREVWITPATISTAPDPSTTGDPAFNSPWSYTELPTVSFPIGVAPDGLPVAIQLVGGFLHDAGLLRAAAWCEQVIRSWQQ